MTQKEKVLNHLRTYGSITVHEAFSSYSLTQLAFYIFKLKEDGHSIRSEFKKHRVTRKRYVRYHLEENITQRKVA